MADDNKKGNPPAERDERRGFDIESLKTSFINHIAFTQARVPEYATGHDRYMALAMLVRDRLIDRWIATREAYYSNPSTKRIYYLSLEFLIGRSLGNSLVNLHLYDECYQALYELGLDLEEIRAREAEAGLGNGGLGRLAACFLDSMATLELPGYGYGIRYEHGMFNQRIRDGQQIEEPDNWLRLGNPWEIVRPEYTFRIQYYGRSEPYRDQDGELRFRWVDTHDIQALPYDMPVPGYRNNTVNTLRLFSAKATKEFDLNYFNHGDYIRACQDKALSENISKVLYPQDDMLQGQELRLKQEYMLVSASLQDILARFRQDNDDWKRLPEKVAIQLNDTHPALAVPELMRLLMDIEKLGWDDAWDITVKVFAYTNHTVLPEALEKWKISLVSNLLPRHLEIIYEINRRFLEEVQAKYPGDTEKLARMSIVEDGHEPMIRMAHLAIVGSHSVNGVSALHTEILKKSVLRDFHEFYPEKFNNKTNGITPRRWLKKANSPLSFLISSAIGDNWTRDLDELKGLVSFADDPSFQERWYEVKQLNKERLASYIRERQGIIIDPELMLDCQTKRIHEYKRQLLNILHVITLYNRLREGKDQDFVPRTVLISGKAAPGYYLAKLIIRLALAVGKMIEQDPATAGRLNLVFPENYGVSLAEYIIPAAELSQQISTAGMEASGTGNMKYALNGALTIGTLDGANVEIMEEVGEENIFIFGMTAEQVEEKWQNGHDPRAVYDSTPELRKVIDQIQGNVFCPHEPGLFQPIVDALLNQGDYFMVMADYDSYIRAQAEVERTYLDRRKWVRMSILNTANMGKFSSDRTILEYAREIWDVDPVPVHL